MDRRATAGLILLAVGLALAGLAAALATAGTPFATTGTSTGPSTGPSCPTQNKPNRMNLAGGSPQTARVGTAFQTSLQVVLANKNGCALTGNLSGVSVTFTAPSSGPSGTFASTGSNTVTVGTDSTGTATAPTFTANRTEGDYEVRAESRYGSVTFHLTNTATGVAASIAATSPNEQSATVNTQYAQPLQVRVLDAHGGAVEGVTVTFALGSGPSGAGASFLGAGGQATAETDAAGLASSPPIIANGTPGPFTATATTGGVGGVVTFSLDNHAAAYAISAIAPAAQTATINMRYAAPLQATVVDDAGRPIEGATVTFTLGTGPSGATAGFVGGGGAQTTALTDASGKAHSTRFVANGTPGRFTATATVPGGTSPVSYPLRNLSGALRAGRATLRARVEHRYPDRLRARLVGARGEPLDGVSVTFTVSKSDDGAGATFLDGTAQATATTNASGWASSPTLVANSVAGTFTATASAAGSGSKPLAYKLENLPGKPDSITAGAASGQSTRAGTRFTIRLAVTVVDADDNRVAGATIVFKAPAGGPSGRFSTRRPNRPHTVRLSRVVRVRTNGDGIAVAPPFTANALSGGFVVTAAVAGAGLHTAFALINKPSSGR